MKKADNFDPSKWLVENKITFQSRLNELLDYSKVEQLGKKAVEDYILKNDLGSIDDIRYIGGSTFSDKATALFYSTSPTGEATKYTAQYDANYNLVDIKTDVIKHTNDNFKPTKIKGIKVNVNDDYVTFLGRSGEYDGNIENDGTISLEIFYPDREEDEEEIDDQNWKNILGPNHVFVKIANSIPTKVETEGDAVGIIFKASDIISMNESNLNKDESTKPLRIGSTITPDMWKPEQQVLGDWKATPFFYKMKWTIVKIAKDYVTDEDDIKELVVSLDSKDYEDMIPLVDLNNALKKEYQIKK